MKSYDYDKKKSREMAWHEKTSESKQSLVSRILHHPVFYEPGRNSFNYIFPKQQMAGVVRRHLKDKKVEKLLIAPCGAGDDLKYLSDFAMEVHGIELSPIAAEKCPTTMKVRIGDILNSDYPDETFDLIASPLFFHHLLKFGFEPFLDEFHRILKKEGKLVILEPSLWYPLNIITRPLKRVARNPFGEVEDEDPFHPGLMLSSLRRAGFTNIEMQAATFSHCSFYVPIAKMVNRFTRPLLSVGAFKYFGWMVVYWAEKE